MMNITVLLFLTLFGTFGIHAQSTRNAKNIHAPWGFPMDANPKDDHLIERKQYVLSYNEHLNVANWVAWQLNATWYGSTPRRSGKFIIDTSLPERFTRITHDDYTKSGYDRGHLVRSEERTANIEDNTSTFLMSNILPQTPTLNQQTWLSLEYECERLCKSEGKDLYVIAGGVFSGIPTRLNSKVAVPDSCWKIVLILEKGQSIKDVSSKTSIIAVMMHNGRYEKTNNDWNLYTTSVDAIERSTGYDFFRDMPDQVENVLEAVIHR